MKICLSYSRDNLKLLNSVDEIKMPHSQASEILDLIEKYPSKTFIIDCPVLNDEELDWKLFNQLNVITKNNLILCVYSHSNLKTANAAGLRAYLGYSISSFWELHSAVLLNSEYIFPGPELFFNLDKVKKVCGNTKIRIYPDAAVLDSMPHEKKYASMWVRPEDLWTVYADYVDAIEFYQKKEAALYNVFCERKEWRQDLNALLYGFNEPALGRLIPNEVAPARISCRQRCLKGEHCRICEHALYLARPERAVQD